MDTTQQIELKHFLEYLAQIHHTPAYERLAVGMHVAEPGLRWVPVPHDFPAAGEPCAWMMSIDDPNEFVGIT